MVVDSTRGLLDYWQLLRRRKWFILLAMLSTTTPAVALTLVQSPVYVAEAQMLLQSKPGESLFGTDVVLADSDRFVANEVRVLEGNLIRERVREALGLEAPPPPVNGVAQANTDVVFVVVRSGNARSAQILANAYVAAYTAIKRELAVQSLAEAGTELQSKVNELQLQVDELDAQIAVSNGPDAKALLDSQRTRLVETQSLFRTRLDQIQVDAALTTGSAQLIQPATEPTDPAEPEPQRIAALAVIVGLLLGFGTALLVDHLDDSIRVGGDLEALEPKPPLLAVIPVASSVDLAPISRSRPGDHAVESYRSLRTNVQFVSFDRDVQVIEVTSAVPGEGKTTTAANLAVVLSQTGSRVILVDADLRRPRVAQMFGITSSLGLTNVLLGEPLDTAVRMLEPSFGVLIAGTVPPNPSELLSGQRMGDLIVELKHRFDYVILDTAPTLPVSDAIALSRHVDAVILVAHARRTTIPQLQQAIDLLGQISAPIIGVVLNRARGGRSGAGTYGYGYSYEATPSR